MPYFPPSIGPSGLTIPAYTDILNYLITQYQAQFGAAVYLGSDSADYQDIAVRALQASDWAQALQLVYLSFNPLTATGPALDLVGQLIGTARRQATYSQVVLTLTGTAGATINNGIAQDTNGNYWNLPSSVNIGNSGTQTAIATAQIIGNITANAGSIIVISTPTAGWSAVTNSSAATPGEAVEPDSQYRARLLISQAKPSLSLVAGTAAAVAAVTGVTRSAIYENYFGFTAGYGTVSTSGTAVTLLIGYPFDSTDVSQSIVINGVTYSVASVGSGSTLVLSTSAGTQTSVPYYFGSPQSLGPAHSITAVVEGGSSTAIAQAIYNNKTPGCLTNGTTSVSVIDPNNGNISLTISFDVLAYVQIYVAVNVHGLTGFTSATQAAIAADIVTYLNSLSIGESVVFSELYGAALNARPNPDMPLFSIRAILSGYEAAQTTGNTNSTTTVTLTSGTGVVIGQTVVGAGIPANTTVANIVSTTLTLSAAATATATGVLLTFFDTGTSDIAVEYNQAASGSSAFVVVNLV